MPRLKAAKNTQTKKKCTKGFPCGYSCQAQGRKCKKTLEGQAATYHEWLANKGIAEAKELIAQNPEYIAMAKQILNDIETGAIFNPDQKEDPPELGAQVKKKPFQGTNKSVGTKVLRSLQVKKQEERDDMGFLFWANLLEKKGGYDVFKEILGFLGNNPKQELSKIVPFKRLSSIDKSAVRRGLRAIKLGGKDAILPIDLLRKLQALRPEATRIHNEARRSSQVSASALRDKEKKAFVERKRNLYRPFTAKDLRNLLKAQEIEFDPKATKPELLNLAIEADWKLHNELKQPKPDWMKKYGL